MPTCKSMRVTPEERFWGKVDRAEHCWEFAGCHNGHGYRTFWDGSRSTYAHRYSYILHHGPIPKGLEIHHTCANRGCVNPDHLEAISHRENVIIGETIAARVANTSCVHGHKYTPENTYIRKNGTRSCRHCNRKRARALRAASAVE